MQVEIRQGLKERELETRKRIFRGILWVCVVGTILAENRTVKDFNRREFNERLFIVAKV